MTGLRENNPSRRICTGCTGQWYLSHCLQGLKTFFLPLSFYTQHACSENSPKLALHQFYFQDLSSHQPDVISIQRCDTGVALPGANVSGLEQIDRTRPTATHWTTQGTSSICFELQRAWKCSLSAPQITSELGTKPVFTHFTWSSLSHAQCPHSCVIHGPSCLGEPKHCLDPGHTGLAGRWASGWAQAFPISKPSKGRRTDVQRGWRRGLGSSSAQLEWGEAVQHLRAGSKSEFCLFSVRLSVSLSICLLLLSYWMCHQWWQDSNKELPWGNCIVPFASHWNLWCSTNSDLQSSC